MPTTRSVMLVIAACLALSGGFAQAKVPPSLDTRGDYEQRLLERLIEDSSDRQYCEVERTHGIDDAVTLISRTPFPNGGNDACVMRAPSPDPFENIARL